MKFEIEMSKEVVDKMQAQAQEEGATGTAAECLQYMIVNAISPNDTDETVRRLFNVVLVRPL